MFSHCSSSEHTPGIRTAKVSPSDWHILQTHLQIQNITPGKRLKVAKENQEIFDYIKKKCKAKQCWKLRVSKNQLPSAALARVTLGLCQLMNSSAEPRTGSKSCVSAGTRCYKSQPSQAGMEGSEIQTLNSSGRRNWLRGEAAASNAQFLLRRPCLNNWKCNLVVWASRYSNLT